MSNELKTISVKQIRGLSGSREIHRKSVKGLGLKKINHVAVSYTHLRAHET